MGVTSGWGFPSYCYLCFPGIASERLGETLRGQGLAAPGPHRDLRPGIARRGVNVRNHGVHADSLLWMLPKRDLVTLIRMSTVRACLLPGTAGSGDRLPGTGDAVQWACRIAFRRGGGEMSWGPCELAHGTHSFPVIPIYHIFRAKSMDSSRLLQKRDSKRFETVQDTRCKCNTAALTRSTFAETRRAGAGRPAERRRAARPDFLRRARSPGSRAAGPPAGGRDWLPAPRSAC